MKGKADGGSIAPYKAGLVAKGYDKAYGLDYFERVLW